MEINYKGVFTMLKRLEYIYDVIENLEAKGYEVSDLEIHNNEMSITYNQYGPQITLKLDLDNLNVADIS